MVKKDCGLFATKANGRWFIKQAKSSRQFKQLCLADERRHGYEVPARSRNLYAPDFSWDDRDKIWRWMDGRPYGPRLPPGARESAAKGG